MTNLKIASFNLKLIYLLGIILTIVWGIIIPITKITGDITFGCIYGCFFEIIWKVVVSLVSIFVLMVLNSYLFTNAFKKEEE